MKGCFAVHPTLEIFGRTFSSYGVCAALGFLAMLLCVALLARRRGYNVDDAVVQTLISFGGCAMGAVVLYGITNIPVIARIVEAYQAGFYDSLFDALYAVVQCFAGFVFYGGLIGAVVACCLYSRHRGWPVLERLDMFSVAVPLFHVFGRLGCFLAGCCYGVEADWGFMYTDAPVAEANGVVRLPIQLIEAACNLAIFALLLSLYLRDRMRGRLVAVYGIAYGLVRFVDEFWRGDVYRGIWGPFSTSQWISIAVVVASVALLVWMRRQRQRRMHEQEGQGVAA